MVILRIIDGIGEFVLSILEKLYYGLPAKGKSEDLGRELGGRVDSDVSNQEGRAVVELESGTAGEYEELSDEEIERRKKLLEELKESRSREEEEKERKLKNMSVAEGAPVVISTAKKTQIVRTDLREPFITRLKRIFKIKR